MHSFKHVHDFHELYILLDNDCNFLLEDKIIELHPFQLIHIPPECYHQALTRDSTTMYQRLIIQFKTPQDPFFKELLDNLSFCRISSNPTLFQHIQRILHYEQILSYEEFDLLKEGLLIELLLLLKATQTDDQPDFVHVNPIISAAINYIDSHLNEPFRLNAIAAFCNVHPNYLSSLFRKHTMVKISDYTRHKQLLLARKYIRNGELPMQIFDKCGFTDYSSFSRAYSRSFGYSPSNDKQ